MILQKALVDRHFPFRHPLLHLALSDGFGPLLHDRALPLLTNGLGDDRRFPLLLTDRRFPLLTNGLTDGLGDDGGFPFGHPLLGLVLHDGFSPFSLLLGHDGGLPFVQLFHLALDGFSPFALLTDGLGHDGGFPFRHPLLHLALSDGFGPLLHDRALPLLTNGLTDGLGDDGGFQFRHPLLGLALHDGFSPFALLLGHDGGFKDRGGPVA